MPEKQYKPKSQANEDTFAWLYIKALPTKGETKEIRP